MYPVGEREFVIGRDESVDLPLADPLLSRRHCRITFEDGAHWLRECGSLNGTRLRGKAVTSPQMLKHGDPIELGETQLVFLTEDDGPAKLEAAPVGAPKLTVLANSSVLLGSLIQGAGALCRLRDTPSIQSKFFSFIFSNTPADRAALSMGGGWTFRERGGSADPFPVDRNTAGATICIPMETPGERGLIYAEVCDDDSHFNNGHIELLSGMAAIAALAFEHASVVEQLEARNSRLQQDLDRRDDMVGDSPAMTAVATLVDKVAAADTTILIQGESGTGKELVARAIHRNSSRAANPFVAINCAAMTETLIESELFGYEKGAFTGAASRKKGVIEEASGGTLFLDEIGEMPLVLQPKLLRALQEGKIRRVGGTEEITIDVRVIAATNRDLAKEVAEKRFREDLFYRLNVVPIRTPPLRERREDIPGLVRYFIQKMARKLGRVTSGISKEAEAILIQYSWPGNVRELENTMERAVLLGSSSVIMPEDLPPDMLQGSIVTIPYVLQVNASRREILLRALREAGGDVALAAVRLGIALSTFYRFIEQLNLKLPS